MGGKQKVGEMEITTKLYIYKTVGQSAIFNNIEVWANMRKKDLEEIERMQAKTLKRLIGVPDSTPYWGLLGILGLWSMEATTLYKKLMLYHQLKTTKIERMGKIIVEDQEKHPEGNNWVESIKKVIGENNLRLKLNKIGETTKSEWKKKVKDEIERWMKDTFEKKKESMKKLRFLKEYGGQDYINQLKSTEVRMTIKTKLNMLPVKDNYGESRVRYRLCDEKGEITQYIINCRQKVEGNRLISEQKTCPN